MEQHSKTHNNRRFFYSERAGVGDLVNLVGEEFNHMINVLRLKVDDMVVLLSGSNEEMLAQITHIDKKQVDLRVQSVAICENEPNTQVTLFQALLKGEKLELVTQKFVELGGSLIQPFMSKFCVGVLNENKQARLCKIADEAVKQCKRAKRVQVLKAIPFSKMLEGLSGFDVVLFSNECETVGKIAECDLHGKNVAIVVGSEGGFSSEEAAEISAHSKSITLGKRILRAETAAITLTALVMHEAGELQ